MYVVYVCGCMHTFDVHEYRKLYSYFRLSVSITIKSMQMNLACRNEDSMKNLQDYYVFWLVLLTGAAQLLLVCGEGSPGMLI